MSTKDQLLELFESNKGIFFSGEEIAGNIGCSRAAVWKAIQTLRSAGYPIEAVPGKGYLLSEASDILSSQGIRKYLGTLADEFDITVLPVVDSTNNYLRERAAGSPQALPDGFTVLADRQTQGRGRVGRSFFSPPDTGIYMSIFLCPAHCSAEQAMHFTTIASVAAVRAIREVSGQEAKIKWVNDIYLNRRKVAGILTEASFGMESGLLDYAVLGIGFNAYTPVGGFPEELRGTVGSVFGERIHDGKNRLASSFLKHFMELYRADTTASSSYLDEYRAYSLVLGEKITVFRRGLPAGVPLHASEKTAGENGGRPAVALNIDDQCGLVVRYDDGSEETLHTGEISIRLRG